MIRRPIQSDFFRAGDPRVKDVTVGVIHYTGGKSLRGDLEYLEGVDKNRDVSASYNALIGEGKSYELLDPEDGRAWHAGKSSIKTGGAVQTNVNYFSIGVAITNSGFTPERTDRNTVRAPLHGTTEMVWWEPYKDEDINELVRVCLFYEAILGELAWVGHESVSPGRKFDPGPLFPWSAFYTMLRGEGPSDLMGIAKDISIIKGRITDRRSGSVTLRSKLDDAIAWAVYLEATK